MRLRMVLMFAVLAAGGLLGWLAASGRLAFAENNGSEKSPFPLKVTRDNYPAPEYRYPNARIGLTAKSSKPDFPPPKAAPKGAPNILLVLLDDVGFGCSSAFGGQVPMPTAERLAKNGLK